MLRRPKHSKIEVVAPKEEEFNAWNMGHIKLMYWSVVLVAKLLYT
jgi:hypothetical protein